MIARCRRVAWARPTAVLAGLLAIGAVLVPPAHAGGLRFQEVSEPWGLQFRHRSGGSGSFYMPETMASGLVLFDYDGDGDDDVFFAGAGVLPGYSGPAPRSALFRNDGARFVDVTERSGIAVTGYAMGAVAGDVDSDGDRDLFVASFGANQLFENRGDGTFADATAESGFGDAVGKGFSAVFADVDEDGWPDLYVANDMTPNLMFHNLGVDAKGRATFEDLGLLSGTAYNDQGSTEAGMGIAIGDLDGDQRPEIMVTHMDDQTNALYSFQGSWIFTDRRFVAGLAEPSVGLVGFGVAFADFDQDGDLDVAVANGHIIRDIEKLVPNRTYPQRNQVFENRGGGKLVEVEGSGLVLARVSRGLGVGDLDGDGDLDMVINDNDDFAEVYENVTPDPGAWLQVDLTQPSGNRFAIGGRVTVTAGKGPLQWREIRTASSYLSEDSLTVHFGMGEGGSERFDRLEVRWPDGSELAVTGLPVDRRLRLLR